MKRTVWQWLVVSSFLLGLRSLAETRPQYGGTLHVATRISPSSLDPADTMQGDSQARRNLIRLVFDTLVSADAEGRAQPALATSWRVEAGNQRWQFWLRKNVQFHDGSPLTAEAVAASLRTGNPDWTLLAANDSIIIQTSVNDPDLLAELAMTRNSIARKLPGGAWVGTGPFRIANWQPQKGVTLTAVEDYWGGRAFLDTIEVQFGRNSRDQIIDFDLGKLQIADVAPEQAHHLSGEGRRVVNSAALELIALVFAREAQSNDDAKLRNVLALSVDRASIRSGVLQDWGEPTAAILPHWISGYAFVFPTARELTRAQEERSEIQRAPALTLGYDPEDALARLFAERIVLNARDAGITLQAVAGLKADIRVARVTLSSANPRIALLSGAAAMGLPSPKLNGSSIEDVYKAENELVRSRRIIPLFQLPLSYAISPAVQNWTMRPDGSWRIADVWLGSAP
jgi:peptide/nickel transport system substrate-binding protein